MSDVQSTRSIEGSPVLPPGGELLLEHAFKLHEGSAIVQKSSFSKGQLPGIFRTLESITINPALLGILIGNPRLFAMVSKFPALLNILISNPELLTILEANPSLILLAITNSRFLVLLSKRPVLLRLVAANPKLFFLLLENSDLLALLETKPSLLAMLGKNSELLAMVTARPELLSKKRSSLYETVENKTKLFQALRLIKESQKKIIINENKLAKDFLQSIILTAKAVMALARRTLLLLSRTFAMVKTPLATFTNQRKVAGLKPIKVLPLASKLQPNTVTMPNAQALNPALLAQLGAIAITTNKGRIIPMSGDIEELETQSERQLGSLEEIVPVHEVEEATEVHLMKETLS